MNQNNIIVHVQEYCGERIMPTLNMTVYPDSTICAICWNPEYPGFTRIALSGKPANIHWIRRTHIPKDMDRNNRAASVARRREREWTTIIKNVKRSVVKSFKDAKYGLEISHQEILDIIAAEEAAKKRRKR